jgi:MFS family permease
LGVRPLPLTDRVREFFSVIARSGDVDRTIFLMRLGNLPFFLVACLVVCVWSWRAFGKPVAVVATGLFTLLPTIMANGGLATTDMALTANVGAAFLATIFWAEKPTHGRTLLLGVFTALSCLSKLSALVYLPATVALALACYLAVRWPGWHGLWRLAKQRAATLALAAGMTALLIWAGYWFSIGQVRSHWFFFRTEFSLPVPAPEFFGGIRNLLDHNRLGHPAFLLGEVRRTGWWYYFPVALAVKTPIAFLILLALGTFVCLRNRTRFTYLLPLAFSLGILVPAMLSRLNIGIRYILPAYFGFSIISALGFTLLFQRARRRLASALAGGVLVVWMTISGALHHPDYLIYFNEFAGKSPEKILVDSNYDWGQELKLLAKRLHQMGVQEVSLATVDGVGNSFPKRYEYLETWYGLPHPKPADTCTPSPGWNVVSTTVEQTFTHWPGSEFFRGPKMLRPWYEQIAPSERVGGLLLYNIPSGTKLTEESCH